MSEALIIDAVRTPIGKHRGALKDVRPDDLAAHRRSRRCSTRTGVPGERVDEVYLGCANQAGEDNRNVARMAALLAGLPQSVPAATVNRLCGSGMEAVIQGCRMIRLGEADIVLAGGRGVDDPRALVDAQARRGLPHRQVGAVRYLAGLALPQPQAGGAVPARADGRDGGERGRADGDLRRGGPGRVRARLAPEGGGGA